MYCFDILLGILETRKRAGNTEYIVLITSLSTVAGRVLIPCRKTHKSHDGDHQSLWNIMLEYRYCPSHLLVEYCPLEKIYSNVDFSPPNTGTENPYRIDQPPSPIIVMEATTIHAAELRLALVAAAINLPRRRTTNP